MLKVSVEYTDYYVARGGAHEVRDRVAEHSKRALLVDGMGKFVPFVSIGGDEDFKGWDWLLRIYDAEDSAWGFELWQDSSELGAAEFGDNAEWGIAEADNGFRGELEATATALGVTVEQLSETFNRDSVEPFCKLVGFVHIYMLYPHEREIPEGVSLVSELG